ncbi:MAG: hypothetical protein AAF808_20010 [Cyanobacteria bacterium P01_D01_bin.2]
MINPTKFMGYGFVGLIWIGEVAKILVGGNPTYGALINPTKSMGYGFVGLIGDWRNSKESGGVSTQHTTGIKKSPAGGGAYGRQKTQGSTQVTA